MPIDASAAQVCPAAAEVYSTADKSAALQATARRNGFEVKAVHAEFGDVAIFTVIVPEKPDSGDGLGVLTGLGSIDKLDEFRRVGGFVSEARPERRDGCVPNAFYSITAKAKVLAALKSFEFSRAGAVKAVEAANRLSLSPIQFSGPSTVIVRLVDRPGLVSFTYRAQRGDFGEVISLGVLASPQTLRAPHNRTPS